MREYLLISLVGGLAVFNSVFLGVMFLANHRGQLKNKILGILFLSLSVRVGKSLMIVWLHDVPDSIPAIGLLGMVATGPLLYLYALQFIHPYSGHLGRNQYWHFLPLLVFALLLFLNNDRIVLWLYVIGTAQLFGYVVLTSRIVQKSQDEETKTWLRYVVTGIFTIGIIYATQIVIETRIAYVIATLIATLVLYSLLFLAFRTQRPFMPIKHARQPDEKLSRLAADLTVLMESEQIFRETDITLGKLASRMGVKPYLVSQAIGSCLKKTFPEWINEYRIREAERLLRSPQFSHYSVEGIGYESGFSTPSAFYSGFKKMHGVTPTAFKEMRA